ncbi:MAG: hypothetical protein LBL21_04410 [Rickettsiales bacterium]|jgi:dCTP deaminase|nr:hypothetical protein [Rickettsiales bacterium]
MQLTGPEIMRVMKIANPNNPNGSPDIVIDPFDEKCLGSNSYDLHLDDKLKIYKCFLAPGMKPAIEYDGRDIIDEADWFYNKYDYGRFREGKSRRILDPFDKGKETVEIAIPENGLILSPLVPGYLGSTVEYTETYNLFPYIDGKSSIGRNFIFIHHTAGRGDDGFCGTWTLELSIRHETLVKPNMRIGQIYYEAFKGDRRPYNENSSVHYNNQRDATAAAALQVEYLKHHTRY